MEQDLNVTETSAIQQVQRLVRCTTPSGTTEEGPSERGTITGFAKLVKTGNHPKFKWEGAWLENKIASLAQLYEVDLRRKYYGYPQSPFRR